MSGTKVKFSRKPNLPLSFRIVFLPDGPNGLRSSPPGTGRARLPWKSPFTVVVMGWKSIVPSLWVLEDCVSFMGQDRLGKVTPSSTSQLLRDGIMRTEGLGTSHLTSTEASAKPYRCKVSLRLAPGYRWQLRCWIVISMESHRKGVPEIMALIAECRPVKGQDGSLVMNWLMFTPSVHVIANLGCQTRTPGKRTIRLAWCTSGGGISSSLIDAKPTLDGTIPRKVGLASLRGQLNMSLRTSQ